MGEWYLFTLGRGNFYLQYVIGSILSLSNSYFCPFLITFVQANKINRSNFWLFHIAMAILHVFDGIMN